MKEVTFKVDNSSCNLSEYNNLMMFVDAFKKNISNLSEQDLDAVLDRFIIISSNEYESSSLFLEFLDNYYKHIEPIKFSKIFDNFINIIIRKWNYSNFISFNKRYESYYNEEQICSVLKLANKYYDHADLTLFIETLYDYFNKLSIKNKNYFLLELKEKVSNHAINIVAFIAFLKRNFDAENENFIDIINTFFEVWSSSTSYFEKIVSALQNHLKNENFKKIVIDDALNSDLKFDFLFREVSNYFSEENYIYILNRLIEENDVMDITLINKIKKIHDKCPSKEVEDIVVDLSLKVKNQEIFLSFLYSISPIKSFSNYDRLIKKANTLESFDSIYRFCSYTCEFDNSDLIERVVNFKDAKYIYEISFFVKDEELKKKLKSTLIELKDENYIHLYAKDIDQTILYEYYTDKEEIINALLNYVRENNENETTKSLSMSMKK